MCAVSLSPAKAQQKRIYIAPDDHTDYMWSADEAAYRQAFLDMLDYYLDLTDSTAVNPSDTQSRFATDGSFWLWTYEKNRTPAEFDRLIGRIRDGHISAPLNALVSTYGAQPAEAVLRGMYYPGLLERQHGIRFRLAVAMENQTLPWGLASLWAGAGAKWSWKGVCDCATVVPNAGDRLNDIYWYTGPDGRKILMKWNSLIQNGSKGMGGYAETFDPIATLNFVSADPGFQTRYPYPVIGCFGHGWDGLESFSDEFIAAAQSMSNAQRRVIVSNEEDFFLDFEPNHGAGLPSQAYGHGNEWDLYSASMNEVTAGVKRSVEKLRTAEGMAALVSLFDPSFMTGRTPARDLAFMDLGLYWEHDWTADGPVPKSARAAWQRKLLGEIEAYVDPLQSDAALALGALVAKQGPNERFFAFNPLGWDRTDHADYPWTSTTPVRVIEVESALEVPSQVVNLPAGRFLRILATNVPAMGYRAYRIAAGPGTPFSDAATVTGGLIENSVYKVTVAARGAITSFVDKTRANREFTAVVGGKAMNDLGAGTGTLTVENAGPVSVTLRATGAAPLAHTSAITLYRDGLRADIENRITAGFSATNTWAFGFNLAAPTVRHEEVGAIATARLITSGGHYSDRQARYDWLTFNHFADISGTGNTGMTLSNADTMFFRLGASTVNSLDTATAQISALAGGQVDGVSLGIQNQGGDTNFLYRFALRPHDAWDPVAAMKMALEHQNPLVCGTITGTSPALPATSFSAISVTAPDVLLWAFKPAEEGIAEGLIARFWNVSDSARTATIQTAPSPVALASGATHIETDEGPLAVLPAGITESFLPQQMRTFRLFPLSIADGDGDGVLRTADCDDSSGAVWATPGEVRSLVLSQPGGAGVTTLAWSPPVAPGGAAPAYDTLRSPSGSDFTTGAACVESGDPGNTTATDTALPGPGAAFFYLVRAGNACAAGSGTLGNASDGTPRLGRACP